MKMGFRLGFVLPCIWSACDMQPSGHDISGIYSNRFGELTETIILNPNHAFSQEIKGTGDRSKKIVGTWERINSAIEFSPYLLCIEPDSGRPFFPPREYSGGR